MNARQKEVLLEAVLHSNAEFTYDIHMRQLCHFLSRAPAAISGA